MKSVHEKRSGSSISFLSGFPASRYLPPLGHSQYHSQVNSSDMQLLSCYSLAYILSMASYYLTQDRHFIPESFLPSAPPKPLFVP